MTSLRVVVVGELNLALGVLALVVAIFGAADSVSMLLRSVESSQARRRKSSAAPIIDTALVPGGWA